MTLKKLATRLALVTAVAALPNISSAAVPHTFAAGDPIRASEVNANYDDLDTRVTTIEGGATTPSVGLDFSSYGLDFSAIGAPKNVVLLDSDDVNGGVNFLLRVAFENNSEQVSIDGVLTISRWVWKVIRVSVDSLGVITNVSSNIETHDTDSPYNGAYGNNGGSYSARYTYISYDPSSLAPTVTDDKLTEQFFCGDTGEPSTLVCHGIGYLTGDPNPSYIYDWALSQSLFGSYTTPNNLTFNEVRFETYSSTERFRIRAKGVGLIFEQTTDGAGVQTNKHLFYFRSDGISGGDLSGTPFEPGVGLLDGLFF
jgi:hypothetical protein